MTSDTGTQGEGSGSAALLRRTPDALDVERLARSLHKSIPCKWQPHAGWAAKTDAEYHRDQAELIVREYDRLTLAG